MPESIKVRAQRQAHCKDCSLSGLCLPLSLNMQDMDALDDIVKRGRPLKKGETLFRQGDSFASVFAVRSGALRTFSVTDNGEEQITGFHLPSELVGLSGMDTEAYPVTAQALETTSVCEIPFDRLDELSVLLPQLRRQLMRIMSREIRDDQQMMLLLSKKTADERIATFLINLSARFSARGFSACRCRVTKSVTIWGWLWKRFRAYLRDSSRTACSRPKARKSASSIRSACVHWRVAISKPIPRARSSR